MTESRANSSPSTCQPVDTLAAVDIPDAAVDKKQVRKNIKHRSKRSGVEQPDCLAMTVAPAPLAAEKQRPVRPPESTATVGLSIFAGLKLVRRSSSLGGYASLELLTCLANLASLTVWPISPSVFGVAVTPHV